MNGLLELVADAYQRNIGNPSRQLVGGGLRGLLGLDMPEYADNLGREAYRTGQALGNVPGVGAPAGAFKAAAKVAPEAAMFIGALAKTWDKSSNAKAVQMEKAGKDAREIWRETGNLKGPDRKWRQEIDDSGARMKGLDGTNKQASMVNLLDHPALYDAYPAKQYYQAEVTSATTLPPHLRQHLIGKGEGSFTPAGPNGEPFIETTAYTPKDTSITLHELQHAIQEREGFAKGGNSMMAFLPQNKEAFALLAQKRREMQTPLSLQEYTKQAWGMDAPTDEVRKAYADYVKTTKQVSPAADRAAQEWAGKEYYRRLAGEAEARATQARMNMTPAERRATFPYDSYDVPVDQLIVRGLLSR